METIEGSQVEIKMEVEMGEREQTIVVDLEYDLKPELIMRAAETEDEMGTVLRIHLMYEQALNFFLSEMITAEMQSYTKTPRDFGPKLALSVALGFPTGCAAVFKHVNQIRNRLAHGDDSLNRNQLNTLASLVNEGLDSFPNEQEGRVRDWFIFLPAIRPDEKIPYGSGDLRLDFCIAAMTFLSAFSRFLLMQAAQARVSRGEYTLKDSDSSEPEPQE